MYLGTYTFTGDTTELKAGYDRLLANFGAADFLVHIAALGDGELTVIDACPDKATFVEFSKGAMFLGAVAAAGLPEPKVTLVGEVRTAMLKEMVHQ